MTFQETVLEDAFHNLQMIDILKNIFHSGRNKKCLGVMPGIPPWMITEEMKLTEHYKMYAEVFGLDVPLIQSQPTESTQGTHRTLSAPRSPNPATETAESSVPKRSTVIRFRLPSRQSARLTPPVPVPTTEKADEMILQDMLQISLAEQKSREEQEARENVELVYEHLAAEEIEKLVEESENVDDSSPTRHDDTSIPGTRIEPRSDKESPEVEIVQEKEEETTKDTEVEPNIVIPVNVDDEEDEITDEVFELRRRAKGKNVEESRISPNFPYHQLDLPTESLHLVSLDTQKIRNSRIDEPLPFSQTDQDDPHDDAHHEGENSAKRQKTSEYETYVSVESSFGQVNVEESGPSTSGNQEQDDEFDFWTDSYASDDDEILTKQVSLVIRSGYHQKDRKPSQNDKTEHGMEKTGIRLGSVLGLLYKCVLYANQLDIVEEISLTIDEAKLKKMANEMLRQRCTLGDEITSHLSSSCQRDPEAQALSLINPDTFCTEESEIKLPMVSISVHQEFSDMGKRIEEYDVFSIVYEPIHGIIYTNSKKEKMVMRPSEIHMFCDATLRRTLEGLKSYCNDVKYGYVKKELTNDKVEFLKLFEEEIEVRLKYRDQMRRWEMYVNGRPLGNRRTGHAQNNDTLGGDIVLLFAGALAFGCRCPSSIAPATPGYNVI
ncbi:hypothetical protein Tco_0327694 [Tanacetum coccineum]